MEQKCIYEKAGCAFRAGNGLRRLFFFGTFYHFVLLFIQ